MQCKASLPAFVIATCLALSLEGCSNREAREVDLQANAVRYALSASGTETFIPINNDIFRNEFNRLEAEKLAISIKHFHKLVEWALVLRYKTLQFSQEAKAKKALNLPLSGQDLEDLSHGIREHLALRREILTLIQTYQDMALYHGDTPWLIDYDVHVKASMLTLAASLVLYDNFVISLHIMQDDTFLRRLINRPNSGFDIEPYALEKVLFSYHSREKRLQVNKALDWLQGQEAWIAQAVTEDNDLSYLNLLINASPSVHNIKQMNHPFNYVNYFAILMKNGLDRFHRLSEESMNDLSKGFGNTVGLVEQRKGKLYNKSDVNTHLIQTLEPMDVLLEKTPFRLTDKLIPGYFGHVALWLGTPDELKALELWDHPLIKPHQKEITEGKRVLEALRNGVVLSTLGQFLNIDDIAVLRLKKIDSDERRAMLVRSFRQLGKDYDFNFNVETLDKIVCSELIYAVYTSINWPTETIVGRSTISPDNVAVMARGNHPFEVVTYYHDGVDQGSRALEQYEAVLTAN